ncbi:hypothetical protein D9M70_450940 [compost metagenome]
MSAALSNSEESPQAEDRLERQHEAAGNGQIGCSCFSSWPLRPFFSSSCALQSIVGIRPPETHLPEAAMNRRDFPGHSAWTETRINGDHVLAFVAIQSHESEDEPRFYQVYDRAYFVRRVDAIEAA